ncbi:MAG: DEAD/DEAH box helicase [Bacteroidales bacterium]|nr:DEAD/DEAH box helicase [Bacteroidales bacterium]
MNNFNEFGLKSEIVKAIDELGFNIPTDIQTETIPAILGSDGDLVALAQTGTGKTAAFGFPVLEKINIGSKNIQALVLCPTRELCMQITSDINKFSKFLNGFKSVAVYGGANIDEQIRKLKKGCHIVVATPGRALDLIRRRALILANIRWLILDEADEMLNMGFKEDIDTILRETPEKRQTLLFSATMPDDIAQIAAKYMKNPREISVGKKNAGAQNVKHEYYVVHAKNRYSALKRIVDIYPSIYGIVFCRTRREAKEVADKLMSDGYNSDALHGDLSQAQRDYVMNRFRLKNIQLLVATDVAARGLDVHNLTHIVNYNLPDDPEIYIHRSGRTGRAGKSGISVSILHTKELGRIKVLEKISQKKFENKKVPGGKEICEKQLFNLIDKVEKTKLDHQIDEYLPVIYKKLEWLSREDLIKHFVSIEFNRFLSYYRRAQDLNVFSKERSTKDFEKRSKSYTRFFINLGTKNGIDANGIIGLINKHTKGNRIELGKIDIMKKFSFFEIGSSHNETLLKALSKVSFDGIPVIVQPSKPDSKGTENRQRQKKKR